MTHENSWGAGAQRWSGKEHIDPALGRGSRTTGGRAGRSHRHRPAANVCEMVATATDLQEALEACEASGMTFVLIDTQPHVEAPCREAANLVDLVVIPCGPSAPDLEAIGATIYVLQETKTPGVIVLNQGRPGSTINA